MTDRLKGCVVTFDRDIREDDAEAILGAIRCLRGVLGVHTMVTDINDHVNRARIRREFEEKLWEVIRHDSKESP